MKRTIATLICIVFLLTPSPSLGFSLSNSKCSQNGKIVIVKKITYTCVFKGSKRVWQRIEEKKKQSQKKPSEKVVSSTPATKATQEEQIPSKADDNSTSSASGEPAKEVKFPITEISLDEKYLNVQDCKLNNKSSQTDVHQGFDQGKFVLSTKKTIRSVIIPIDFPDLAGVGTPSVDFEYITEGVSGYYRQISEGKINFAWEILPTYMRYPQKVSEIRLGGADTSGFTDFSVTAKSLAKEIIDFKKYDLLIFAPPLSTTRSQIAFGPAFLSFSENDINSTMLDGQAYEMRNQSGALTTAHEIGHLMGLADLYNFNALADAGVQSPNDSTFLNAQFKFMGAFDLMNNVGGAGVELIAWNRWLIGAIDDNQIRCLPKSSTTTLLTSMALEGGIKGAVIPVSSSEVIVVESRKSSRFDLRLGSSGVLVYRVDTSVKSGNGPVTLIRRAGSSNPLGIDALLKPADSVVYKNFQIRVVESGATGDVVEVKFVG